jgi:hypothetical protein
MPRLDNTRNGHTVLAGKLPAQDPVGRSERRGGNKIGVTEVGNGCN